MEENNFNWLFFFTWILAIFFGIVGTWVCNSWARGWLMVLRMALDILGFLLGAGVGIATAFGVYYIIELIKYRNRYK